MPNEWEHGFVLSGMFPGWAHDLEVMISLVDIQGATNL